MRLAVRPLTQETARSALRGVGSSGVFDQFVTDVEEFKSSLDGVLRLHQRSIGSDRIEEFAPFHSPSEHAGRPSSSRSLKKGQWLRRASIP